jgi:hypothetical protein
LRCFEVTDEKLDHLLIMIVASLSQYVGVAGVGNLSPDDLAPFRRA